MPKIDEQELRWNVYHYTDLNALINILGKDNIILRATNILYLNDPRELLEGIDVVNETMGCKISSGVFRNYYLTSFSDNSDDLNMWGMYAANGCGCALAFDYDELSKVYLIMARCIYGKKEIKDSFISFHNLSLTADFMPLGGQMLPKSDEEHNRRALAHNNIIWTSLGAKNDAYRFEKETRGVLYCSDKEKVKFRTRGGYIVPYVEVILPKCALKEIVIGPTDYTILKEQSIIHFLQINGYDLDAIKLVRSQIPYRG